MEATLYRKIDKLGRFYIPNEIREKWNLKTSTPLLIKANSKSVSVSLTGETKGAFLIRSIDSMGRIIIPAEYRQQLKITKETVMAVTMENDTILITIPDNCAICSNTEHLIPFESKYICSHCIELLKRKIGV